jgi:hypothetical protein
VILGLTAGALDFERECGRPQICAAKNRPKYCAVHPFVLRRYLFPAPIRSEPWEEEVMSDDLSNRGPADRARVNVNESWERAYWCKQFGCTEQQLRDAVTAVGVMADAVRRHLGK